MASNITHNNDGDYYDQPNTTPDLGSSQDPITPKALGHEADNQILRMARQTGKQRMTFKALTGLDLDELTEGTDLRLDDPESKVKA